MKSKPSRYNELVKGVEEVKSREIYGGHRPPTYRCRPLGSASKGEPKGAGTPMGSVSNKTAKEFTRYENSNT